MPLNVQVNRSREWLSINSTPYTLHVSWDAPENSEKFDLEYFKVHIMQENQYITNGTSREQEYHFHSDVSAPQTDMHIVVAAVNKCSQQGLRSPVYRVEWGEDTDIKATFTIVPDTVGKTEKVFRDCNVHMMNGKFKIYMQYFLQANYIPYFLLSLNRL